MADAHLNLIVTGRYRERVENPFQKVTTFLSLFEKTGVVYEAAWGVGLSLLPCWAILSLVGFGG
ncbi:hypothetical protein [Candidatus Poriferisocius sp.]|uniref:hypothetical protein n=1 Tax=Candidatus Poriferisocius sp. TaxID=3101276 RepID=UPI003B0109C4